MNPSPHLAAFLAVTCLAVLPVLAKKLQLDVPPFAFIAITMAGLCVFASIASFCVEKEFSVLAMNTKIWMGLILFSAVNFVGFAIYLFAIRKIPVAHYQLIGLATPIVGAVFAFWLLGEKFKPQYLIGLVFIAAGLFIALSKTAD